uniref:Uncharacterized protein n=1 Tax=Coccolithus braarudii TaxID=221442 RepID=A0A7S0Q676_9EUKA|mmetsp:Transcript_4654/g.10121  ORF Transcript_4654/g.10121 Transcript_4654/m.10121 type:complete len:136 (+) Transcript_4654:198-605(+)|eukprot:CAMPEP_0183360480 /NCGR_PEP_ID=MMETSP0164_2-20130417/55288_1 /TAXON_ID=221442 /ORGANISM="Coccolithus pelagicus ssp braarudi, Strain PLY182g" /LENGTH=135 /DNA_ID=CAMNT_0025534849 /DNA_START=195 /DNA_END=602 /DNA_ORIENTATION=-
MGLLKKSAPKPEEAYNAVKSNNKTALAELVGKGCNVNGHKDQFTGDQCIHAAANKGRKELIDILLASHADVNSQNKIGQTALHCAAGYGYAQVVQKLLSAGANTSVQDQDGNTPADLAKAYANCPEVIDILTAAG